MGEAPTAPDRTGTNLSAPCSPQFLWKHPITPRFPSLPSLRGTHRRSAALEFPPCNHSGLLCPSPWPLAVPLPVSAHPMASAFPTGERGFVGGDVSALTDQQGSPPGASHLPSCSVLSGAPAPFQAVLLNSDPTTPPAPLALSGAALPPVPRPTTASVPASSFQLLSRRQLPPPVLCEASLSPRNGSICSQVNTDPSREQLALALQAQPTQPAHHRAPREPRQPDGTGGVKCTQQLAFIGCQIMDYSFQIFTIF